MMRKGTDIKTPFKPNMNGESVSSRMSQPLVS
jgi:hypothetical protein